MGQRPKQLTRSVSTAFQSGHAATHAGPLTEDAYPENKWQRTVRVGESRVSAGYSLRQRAMA